MARGNGKGSARSRHGRAARCAAGAREPRGSLYDEVTASIIAQLEEGVFAWVRPWSNRCRSSVSDPHEAGAPATGNRRNGMMPDEETCWDALVRRDKAFDGAFLYGVMTTGVYCRPSCAARLPRRGNVRFYAAAADAEADDLRACLRCRPLASAGCDPNVAIVESLCRHIEAHAEEKLTLAGLGRIAGLSPFHLQRSFKAITGVSPKAYQDRARIALLKRELREGGAHPRSDLP